MIGRSRLSTRTSPLAVAVALLIACAPASAASIAAEPVTDAITVNGHCSLREAINAANDNNAAGGDCVSGTSGSDTITLVAGSYNLGIGGANEEVNATGDLDITEDLTITGPGAGLTTVDAQGLDRAFDARPGANTTISGVTIRGGSPPPDIGSASYGGGIRAASPLTLDHVVVTQNQAGYGANGGIAAAGGAGGGGGGGGGVRALGLTVLDSTITENYAGDGGTGGGPASCSAGTSGGNGGDGGTGGGIMATNAVIRRSTITLNVAGKGGNGGCAPTPGNGGHGGSGGGVFASALELTDSIVSDNVAGNGGVSGSDGDGPNSAFGGGGGHGGGIYASASGSLISNTLVSGNGSGAGGAGGFGTPSGSAQSAVAGPGGLGGGIAILGHGATIQPVTVTIASTTIAGNHTGGGGGSPRGQVGDGGPGGGLAITATSNGPTNVTVTRSLINANVTGNGAASIGYGGNSGSGGGVYVADGNLPNANAAALVSDTTLAANLTGNGGNSTGLQGGASGGGAGIAIDQETSAALAHVTVAGNQTGSAGTGTTPGVRSSTGGLLLFSAATVPVGNSIFSANQPSNCETPSFFGPLQDDGHNVVFGGQCDGITAITSDPFLGPLADNGGPTKTMALAEGSPALDIVPSSGSGCTATDQRGIARPQGSACDAGAFEIDRTPPPGDPPAEQPPASDPGTQPEPQPETRTATVDDKPPTVRLLLTKQKLRKVLAKGFVCSFDSDELGSATCALGKSPKRGARLTKTGKQKLVLKFSKKAKKKLARKKRATFTLTLIVKDAAGNATTKTAKVTLKR